VILFESRGDLKPSVPAATVTADTVATSTLAGTDSSSMEVCKDKEDSASSSTTSETGSEQPEADTTAAAPAQTAVSTATTSVAPKAVKVRPLSYKEAFHLATVGGAEALGMGKVVGNFVPGKKLDCLIVDPAVHNGPFDLFDGEGPNEFFQKFLFLGDDRNIVNVFVDGRQVI